MQSRCYVNGCFLNNSRNAHMRWLLTKMTLHNFISLQTFTVYMENTLWFQFPQMDQIEICTKVS